MNALVLFAILLLVLWILAKVLGFVVGAVLNLLWIAALVLLGFWIVQKIRART